MIPSRRNIATHLSLLLTLFSCMANGQSMFFANLSTRDGLPSNVISALAQDRYNFIWTGTSNGLSRYDGYRFRTFKRDENDSSLPTNEISCLLADGDTLWVGTWRGLCKINVRDFKISRVNLGENVVIRTLFKDSQRQLWIGTANGLIRLSPDRQRKVYTSENSNLSHNTIRAILQDSTGNLWVGCYDKLNKLPKGEQIFTQIDLKGNYKPSLKNNLICDIKPVKDHNDLLWVGTETGLCQINIHSLKFTHYTAQQSKFSNEVIKNIYTDLNGRLWLGTDFGLNLFDPTAGKNESYFHNPQATYSIANNVIWQIFEDSGAVIWIVTANGLSRINKADAHFDYHPITHQIEGHAVGNQVKSLLAAQDGALWIATVHGVIRIDRQTNTRKVFDIDSPPNERLILNNVFTLEEDDRGRIWIGTAGGINVWDEKQHHMFSITADAHNGLTTNYIAKFTKGQDGSFWVSAWEAGLFKLVSGYDDLEKVRFEFVGDFASERNVYARNAIWGLRNNELYRIDLATYVAKKISTFSSKAKSKDVFSLHYSQRGSIWAGTQNGLIEYQPEKDSAIFHAVTTGNEIDLNNILSDDYGNIWAATDKLILKFSAAHRTTEIFPLDADLPLKTFYNNCSAHDGDGSLLFGGDNGFIRFSPKIQADRYRPNIVITNLEINNKSISPNEEIAHNQILKSDIAFTRELVLDYAKRSVTFQFSALHYWQPQINVYAYKLEGIDKEWQFVSGKKNFAVYSNLAPGTYTFKVRGSNNYGIWNDVPATIKLTIKPPLFLSLPFIALYIVLAMIGLIFGLRIYAVRLKLKNELRIAVLEKEHAEEIVQTKQQFFTSISHELRTPISLIIPPIQQVLKKENLDSESRTLIHLAEKNSQRLLRLINQILDFRKLEHENQSLRITWFDLVPFCQELYTLFSDKAARNDINFTFTATVTHCTLWADKEKIEIIIFNLLSNAFKFTPRGGSIELAIGVDEKSQTAYLRVTDNGVGIAVEDQSRVFDQFYQTSEARRVKDGSGIGLTLVSAYTKLHHGTIELESASGKGSIFNVRLPINSDHFPVDLQDQGSEVSIVAARPPENQSQDYAVNLRADKPLILFLEDNVDMIDFVTLSLRKKYAFIKAENGQEGLTKALHLLPDVIISDIMMPVMDGIEFCRLAKQDHKISHIPIILLTAKSLISQKIEGIRMGADIYITKPFEIELLEAHVDHLLERKAELAQYFKQEIITQPLAPAGGENEDDRFLKKVMNTIEANISNPDFSVEQLSDEIGMSSTHLYRKLKSLTHVSANEIIKKYRIKKASLLLKNKEGNISEIMYEVGFSSLSYFSKCFKSEFGITPKEYQQKESKHSFDVQHNIDSQGTN